MNWTVPKTVKYVKAFLEFPNFYRWFIRVSSELAFSLPKWQTRTCRSDGHPNPKVPSTFWREPSQPSQSLSISTPRSKSPCKPMYLTMSLMVYSLNMVIMLPFDPYHLSPQSTPLPNTTTRFMTKNYRGLFDPLRNGDGSLKGLNTHLPSYPIRRTSSTLWLLNNSSRWSTLGGIPFTVQFCHQVSTRETRMKTKFIDKEIRRFPWTGGWNAITPESNHIEKGEFWSKAKFVDGFFVK